MQSKKSCRVMGHLLMMALVGILSILSSMAFAEEKTLVVVEPATGEKIDVKAILDKFDDLWRGESSESKMTMNIKTAHWERSLSMHGFSLGKDYSLVRVLKPLKERGTSTLKVEKEIYNYLPKTDRTIKITSAMMLGSWMGSHFTNDDLVKESRMADDYETHVSFHGERDGQKVIELSSIPRPDAAVVWGKVIVQVREADWQPLKVTYYDEEGEAVREMTLSDHKKVSGRLLPLRMKMLPLDKPGEYTEVIYDELNFDAKLSKSFFSLNQLKR